MSDYEDGVGDVSDDDMEAVTAAEVLKKLEEAWLNERFSPELLETKSDIVDCMMEQVHEMEENIRRAKKGDFKVSIHKMEIDRIRYVLSSYLRTRIEKIEKYTTYILEQESQRGEEDPPHLSPEEFQYAKEYLENVEGHLNSLALRHMPPNLQTPDPRKMLVEPNLDQYVFLRVNEDTDGVLVEEETAESREEILDMEQGNQHVMRYRPIASLVASSAVSLI